MGLEYYTEKKKCYAEIDRILKDKLKEKDKKIELSLLYYIISVKYGFGKKLVNDYLDLLEELSKIKIKEGVVYVN